MLLASGAPAPRRRAYSVLVAVNANWGALFGPRDERPAVSGGALRWLRGPGARGAAAQARASHTGPGGAGVTSDSVPSRWCATCISSTLHFAYGTPGHVWITCVQCNTRRELAKSERESDEEPSEGVEVEGEGDSPRRRNPLASRTATGVRRDGPGAHLVPELPSAESLGPWWSGMATNALCACGHRLDGHGSETSACTQCPCAGWEGKR